MTTPIYGQTTDEVRLEDACDRLGLDPADRRYILAEFRRDPSLIGFAFDMAILKYPILDGVEPDATLYTDLGLEEFARMALVARNEAKAVKARAVELACDRANLAPDDRAFVLADFRSGGNVADYIALAESIRRKGDPMVRREWATEAGADRYVVKVLFVRDTLARRRTT